MYEDYFDLIADRFSVRKFTNEPIDDEIIDKILKAGNLAPTACNKQPQRILVIKDEEGMAQVKKCTLSHFDATAAILVSYEKSECWVRDYDGKTSGDIDASIVATHMMLAAAALGVGVTWVMHFIPEAIHEELGIIDSIEPVALLVMGYPAPDAKPYPAHSKFRPMSEIVSYYEDGKIQLKQCIKESFTVIGKEGSTEDGDGFIQDLWMDANEHFNEIQDLVKRDEKGNFAGFWGAMSDLSRSFQPWEENFTKGLYLAGAECVDDAEAPRGWTKWVIPGYEYLYTVVDRTDTFPQAIDYLREHGISLAGAVHDYTCPEDGKNYMFFPVRRL